MRKNQAMRLVSLCGLICVLLLLSLSFVFAANDVPQVYTYVLRPTAGQTDVSATFKDGTSSFESVITNAPYRIGTLTLTHYKLSQEPISKFSLAKRTYEYVTLESNTTILQSDGVTGKISFHVDKSWLDSVSGKPEQISLYFFDGDNWKQLDTKFAKTSGGLYEYDAYTFSFGYFAIALDRSIQSSTTTSSAAAQSVTGTDGASGSTSDQTVTQPLDSQTDTASAPQSTDSGSQSAQVVYPLLDDGSSSSTSGIGGISTQKLIGYGLLFFAVTGVAIVGITVAQSRSNRPAQFKPGASVTELLAQLQANRTLKTPSAPVISTDINALLQKVHARYQPTFSLPKTDFSSSLSSLSNLSGGSTSFAHSLTHSIEELKEKVSQLEPDLIKRYTDWGISHGHNLDMIKQDLLAHDIDESAVNRVLSQNCKKF